MLMSVFMLTLLSWLSWLSVLVSSSTQPTFIAQLSGHINICDPPGDGGGPLWNVTPNLGCVTDTDYVGYATFSCNVYNGNRLNAQIIEYADVNCTEFVNKYTWTAVPVDSSGSTTCAHGQWINNDDGDYAYSNASAYISCSNGVDNGIGHHANFSLWWNITAGVFGTLVVLIALA